MRYTRYENGFSLVEVLISVILVGLAVAALVVANGSFTMANSVGTDLSTAEFLIEQIRELTALLPVIDPQSGTTTFGPEEASLADYDDVDDFDGATFSPPINSNRVVLSDFAAFSQQVTVENINSANFEQIVADHSSDFVRITIQVFLNAEEISSTRLIRARY